MAGIIHSQATQYKMRLQTIFFSYNSIFQVSATKKAHKIKKRIIFLYYVLNQICQMYKIDAVAENKLKITLEKKCG